MTEEPKMSNPPEGDREKIARIKRLGFYAERLHEVGTRDTGVYGLRLEPEECFALSTDLRAILAALTPVVGSSRDHAPTAGDALVGAPREGWATIDSAPKNATDVLVWWPCKTGWPTHRQMVAHWAQGGGEDQPRFGPAWYRWDGYGHTELVPQPTHWRPLPDDGPLATTGDSGLTPTTTDAVQGAGGEGAVLPPASGRIVSGRAETAFLAWEKRHGWVWDGNRQREGCITAFSAGWIACEDAGSLLSPTPSRDESV